MSILMGVIGAALLLTVAYEILWPESSQESRTESERYTPPIHRPQQRRPVYQPPPRLPSQSSRSSLYTPPNDTQEDQPNEHHLVLRARAKKEGNEMERCFNERREANRRGDRAAAKDFSKQGKIHQQKMEQLHTEASDLIYHENNRVGWLRAMFTQDTNSVIQDCRPGEIDLHRLRVKEAIARTNVALEEAQRQGDSEIRIIVGKGLHSEGGEARVRPAIKNLMRKYKLVAEFDPSNSGVLIVKLDGSHPNRLHHHFDISHRRSGGRRRQANNIRA
ncbi:Smr domain-containing protein [Armillaria novae-zelandiae]|uniref:Smr domain-containing protein n=1 Tax=Armillaria novae-zelandiae TaxID=153914 RepID=A0AA39P4R0_9AGAR|nr:Smr domain-containing protein [Armillaria novae-zelandiae]